MVAVNELPFLKYFTRNLLIASFLIGISVFNYGFDQTGYSTIQAMDPFINRFGTYDSKTQAMVITTKNLSLLNSIPRITFGLGVLIGGVLGERFGRRPVYILMLLICLVGTIVSYTARSYGQILVGRMLNQMYIGIEGWLVPMFQAEIIPAPIRGVVVVGYVFNHVFGSFIMSCITYKTAQWDTDQCWQIPIATMFIIPSFALLLSFMVPESPRWLLRKGRKEEALKMLRFIYGSNPEYAPEEELALLEESLELEMDKGSWKELVTGSNRRRTSIVFVIQVMNQLTGQAFSSQYGTVFIKTLGTINPYSFTVIANAIGCIGPFANFFLIERMGRRNMYLFFGTLCCASLFTLGGLGLGNGNFHLKAGIVAMTIIYPLFYIMSFGGMAPVIGAEIPSLRLRDKTSVVGWSVQNLAAFVVTFTIPYLLNAPYAHLESKVGFIYGGVCILALVWAWFCLPEVGGRSLEEIDDMFQSKVPTRDFKKWASSDPNSVGARITRMEGHAAHAGKTTIYDDKVICVTEEDI
ncbi:hypothetical protein BP5796_01280 [Coleophoma crateriformis]|uniref:Major facilitator superfamily (MFS) profile domain-containing protein n=1 Tax=Coleophoma crateriformis TaxID=565419 RepID=A0A3D8T009_9HELO|nr:hypothetical protein BP5796_01280 [Coleophoma crateriformis]